MSLRPEHRRRQATIRNKERGGRRRRKRRRGGGEIDIEAEKIANGGREVRRPNATGRRRVKR